MGGVLVRVLNAHPARRSHSLTNRVSSSRPASARMKHASCSAAT